MYRSSAASSISALSPVKSCLTVILEVSTNLTRNASSPGLIVSANCLITEMVLSICSRTEPEQSTTMPMLTAFGAASFAGGSCPETDIIKTSIDMRIRNRRIADRGLNSGKDLLLFPKVAGRRREDGFRGDVYLFAVPDGAANVVFTDKIHRRRLCSVFRLRAKLVNDRLYR